MMAITESVYKMLIRALHVTYTPDEDTEARIRAEGAQRARQEKTCSTATRIRMRDVSRAHAADSSCVTMS